MTDAEAQAVVERAVASYAAWAERDEAMRSTDGYAANPEYEAFRVDLQRCLELDPKIALELVTPFLSSENPFERAAAGRIIGRLGEANLGAVSRPCSDLLFARLLGEADDEARDSIACGLGLIWNASGDEATPLELAGHPNANVRIAAAQNLAMTTTDRPDDADARAALQLLLEDPDERVRGWAEVGLETLSIS
jgi:HEAT repeat protein